MHKADNQENPGLTENASPSAEVSPDETKTRFHDFDLPETLMQAIQDLGFTHCTPIQAEIL